MTRHSLAEILLMVLAVCGAVAILCLIGSWLLRLIVFGTAAGGGGVAFGVSRVSVILFSVVIIAAVAIAIALTLTLKSWR
jgi:hypothetical protein